MTLPELMLQGAKSAISKAGKDLLVGAIVIGISGFAVHSCNRVKTTKAELLMAEETIALRDAQIDSFEVSNEELKKTLKGAKEESVVLRETLKDAERRIKEATGKAPKVVEVVKYVTIPGPAGGEAPPGREALIAHGDTLQIRGTSVKLETRAGNHVVTGVASCWRLQPLPETKLYEGAVDMGSVKAVEAPRPIAIASQRRWAAGPVGTMDTSGNWAVGPQVGYRIWRVDASLGMTFPDQRTVGSVLVRW